MDYSLHGRSLCETAFTSIAVESADTSVAESPYAERLSRREEAAYVQKNPNR
jgi:hypothetical protein